MELVGVSFVERLHIDSCADDVWANVREFGHGAGLRADGSCSVSLLPGSSHTALGALRYTTFRESGSSGGGFVERLLALDDRDFKMKWVLITHELNENPFASAFMDWKAQLRLYKVTVSNTTLVEWSCSFRTFAHSAAEMHAAVRAMVVRGLQAMAPYIAPPRPPRHCGKESFIGVMHTDLKMRVPSLPMLPMRCSVPLLNCDFPISTSSAASVLMP